jgi:hypothetical protein
MKNKERINEILQAIANILFINQHKIQNTGLLNGKMGIAIYLYHYARYCGNNVYEEFADDFVDEVMNDKSNNVRHPNFPGSISGLAWGFNYLIEYKFIEIEDNTVLIDLEDFLLENIPSQISMNNPDTINLFGSSIYYASKLKRQAVNEKDIAAINTFIKKCLLIIKEDGANSVFDIKYFNSLLYFLTETAKNKINKRTVSSLLSIIGDILLRQPDYSIYNNEDIYILRKNIEQVLSLTSKKDKWNQIQSKLPDKPLSGLAYFNWQNFIYFSYANIQIDNYLLNEIETFIEQELDNLQKLDFTLTGKLLNIGIGLLRNIQ